MDTTIHPVPGITRISTPLPGRTTTDTPLPAHTETYTPKTSSGGASAPRPGQEEAHYEAALRKAALSFSDTYAISDKSFTIFKDSEGKYITRYTSLRDGKVTYIPEPALLRQIQQSPAAQSKLISITA